MTETRVNAALAATLAKRTRLDVRTTETGGGCTALMATLPGQFNDPDAAHVLITAGLDASFPLLADGTYQLGVVVAAYAAGGAYDEPTELFSLDEHTATEMWQPEAITGGIEVALTTWRDAQPQPQPQAETPAPATDLTAALAEMARVFGDLRTASDTGSHMTCSEANALAKVLALAGHRDAAARCLMGHATGDDDDDDQHCELATGEHDSRVSADIAEDLARAAAVAYVAQLVGE